VEHRNSLKALATYSLVHWARFHTVDATALRKRWQANPEGNVVEALLDPDRFNEDTEVWTIKSELELIRLLGGLQWTNQHLKLWYRGENRFYTSAVPSRTRPEADTGLIRQGREMAQRTRLEVPGAPRSESSCASCDLTALRMPNLFA
jgi:hypothetical protein